MIRIMIRSSFSGWHEISEKEAIDYAKCKFKALYQPDHNKLLNMINSRFKGISFTLDQLK